MRYPLIALLLFVAAIDAAIFGAWLAAFVCLAGGIGGLLAWRYQREDRSAASPPKQGRSE